MRLRVKSASSRGAQRKEPAIEKAARAAVTMAARRDAERFVPKVSGDLRQTPHYMSDPERGELVYGDGGRVRYAKPQYYAHPHKTMPGTVMKWFEHAKPQYARTWAREGELAAREAARRG